MTTPTQEPLPPLSALFLINFDIKAGYTIAWKKTIPGLDIDGIVEYKSLPSGLHAIPEDLVYFVHDAGHAGLSAFVNTPTDEDEARHARMIAIGILVPLTGGRLGRAWRHAAGVKELARRISRQRNKLEPLEQYWLQHQAMQADQNPDAPSSPLIGLDIPKDDGPVTAGGSPTAPPETTVGSRLSPFHPAWSLPSLLRTFGPLIFPIHRAALLRKRILVSGHAPVHEACNFVYDISVISNVPLSVHGLLGSRASSQRLRPLFNVGIHDIPALKVNRDASDASAWIACTTDSILAAKPDLWDILIALPPPQATWAAEKQWPTIVRSSRGAQVQVKATQRDLRRYYSFMTGLACLAAVTTGDRQTAKRSSSSVPTAGSPSTSHTPRIRLESTPRCRPSIVSAPSSDGLALLTDQDVAKIVEPTTWSALAYSGFMWWASAGEQSRAEEAEEAARDTSLLADMASSVPPFRRMPSMGGGGSGGRAAGYDSAAVGRPLASRGVRIGGPADRERDGRADEEARVELAILTYFHRLTAQMLSVLGGIAQAEEDEEDERPDLIDVDGPALLTEENPRGGGQEEEEEALLSGHSPDDDGSSAQRAKVFVDSDGLLHMGLGVWSAADMEFVRDLCVKYFGREAYVESKGLEVCGLRVC